MTVTLAAQIRELERELAMRRRVYPDSVARGRMTETQMVNRIAALVAAIETLRGLGPQQQGMEL